jgi:thiamine-monophosphate kinase
LISVTALGEAKKAQVITRAGAKPGDRIFVTGALGDSAAGMEMLKAGSRVKGQGARGHDRKFKISIPKSVIGNLISRHLRPAPRVEWGSAIARSGCANAMIDISDGLSSDLAHICEQSGVGALVQSGNIPLSRSLMKTAERLKKPSLHYALSGGEDYELLFTVPQTKLKRLAALKIPATEIGVITRGHDLVIADARGREKPLVSGGYDHFMRS